MGFCKKSQIIGGIFVYNKHMEIERRFKIVSPIPKEVILNKEMFPIMQGYGKKIRVRKKGEKNFMTVKEGKGLVRKEWEIEIPEWVFKKIWEGTEGKRLEKDRYVIPYTPHTLELDIYKGVLAPLVILECEFQNEKDAKDFVLPEWARDAIEVTSDDRYSNRSLATHGLPKD
jgi:CYTH domain-containing protein